MTLSFSTQRPLSDDEVIKHLDNFSKSYTSSRDNKDELSKINKNTKELVDIMNDSLRTAGLSAPLNIQAWIQNNGEIGAVIVKSRSNSKASFRDTSGNLKKAPDSLVNPLQKVSDIFKTETPHINIAIRGQSAAVSMSPQAPGSIQELFEQTLLANFIVSQKAPLDPNMPVHGNIAEREATCPGIEEIHKTAQQILSVKST